MGRVRGMLLLPAVIAMSTWNTDRSGYWSPMAADTEGNHSSGYPNHSFFTTLWKWSQQAMTRALVNAAVASSSVRYTIMLGPRHRVPRQ